MKTSAFNFFLLCFFFTLPLRSVDKRAFNESDLDYFRLTICEACKSVLSNALEAEVYDQRKYNNMMYPCNVIANFYLSELKSSSLGIEKGWEDVWKFIHSVKKKAKYEKSWSKEKELDIKVMKNFLFFFQYKDEFALHAKALFQFVMAFKDCKYNIKKIYECRFNMAIKNLVLCSIIFRSSDKVAVLGCGLNGELIDRMRFFRPSKTENYHCLVNPIFIFKMLRNNKIATLEEEEEKENGEGGIVSFGKMAFFPEKICEPYPEIVPGDISEHSDVEEEVDLALEEVCRKLMPIEAAQKDYSYEPALKKQKSF